MRSVAAAISLLGLFLCGPARALETVKVTDGIYAFVGGKSQRSPRNLGNNATFGLVVTTDGAMLIIRLPRAVRCPGGRNAQAVFAEMEFE